MTPKQTPPLSDFDLYRSHFNQIPNGGRALIQAGNFSAHTVPLATSGKRKNSCENAAFGGKFFAFGR